MAPLPRKCASESTPFSRVGSVGTSYYLSPLYVKDTNGASKVWMYLFTCLVTRAVHLKLMNNMSSEDSLMGLRRFVASRGTSIEIIMAHAKNVKSSSIAIDLLWTRIVKCEDVQNYVSDKGIKWNFIVELAPWMKGFYERLVGLVKRSLRKSVGRKLLTITLMQTVIKEIERDLNSRPLVYIGDDINSIITLAPGNFLVMNPKVELPDTLGDNDDNFDLYESSAQRLL